MNVILLGKSKGKKGGEKQEQVTGPGDFFSILLFIKTFEANTAEV